MFFEFRPHGARRATCGPCILLHFPPQISILKNKKKQIYVNPSVVTHFGPPTLRFPLLPFIKGGITGHGPPDTDKRSVNQISVHDRRNMRDAGILRSVDLECRLDIKSQLFSPTLNITLRARYLNGGRRVLAETDEDHAGICLDSPPSLLAPSSAIHSRQRSCSRRPLPRAILGRTSLCQLCQFGCHDHWKP